MKRALLAGVALLAMGSLALPQPIVQPDLSGTECWNAGQGPGGTTIGFVCTYLMRNGAGMTVISGSGAFTTTATTQQSTLYWHSTAPTSWTITTPVAPFDGEILQVGTDTTLTTMVTLTANTGQSLSSTFSAQTITANTAVEWQYSRGTATWYRIH